MDIKQTLTNTLLRITGEFDIELFEYSHESIGENIVLIAFPSGSWDMTDSQRERLKQRIAKRIAEMKRENKSK